MKKKNITGFIISLFLALGGLFFATNKIDTHVANAANDLVGNPEVAWNNVDYSRDMGHEWVAEHDQNGVPTNGYCLLPLYESNIATQVNHSSNLLDQNIPGSNYKDHILINGVECQNVEGVILYAYPTMGFFIYVPQSSFRLSAQYEYLTIEVLEGMSLDGAYKTVGTRFEYRGILGSFGNWQVNPEPVVRTQSSFHSFAWNNVDYSPVSGADWCGELLANGAPKNGYCMLAFFNEEGKTPEESKIGDITNKGRGVLGIGLAVDYLIKVNGVDIIDVEGAKCYIYPTYGLFFYIPDSSITWTPEYDLLTISLLPGIHFNSVNLPEIEFVFMGGIGDVGCWSYNKDESEYIKPPFMGVPNEWNNIDLDAMNNQTIMQFGEYQVDYLKNDGVSNGNNVVNKYSDCGKKITLNGVRLCDIDGALISYLHGYCYLYLVLPKSALAPSNGYKVVTLHIEEKTKFYDTMLPELNLYLFDGRWTQTRPETPSDEDYANAISFSSVFNQNEATLDSENNALAGSKTSSVNSFSLSLNYKLKTNDTALHFYLMGSRNLKGLRLTFNQNSLFLYDSTDVDTLLSSAEIKSFQYDEWYSLLFYTKVVDGKLSVSVAVDDITYVHATNVNIANQENIGNSYSILLGSGSASFRNDTPGADIKKPLLSYTGKASYGVLTGSDAIDFTNKVTAFDAQDGNVTNLIEINWDNGALTNNKVNKGTWKVHIVAKDRSNNISEVFVTVIAADKLDVVVTFDGQNPVNYRVGDHIAYVPDPVKEDADKTYKFIGWYYNGVLWDFENDYVVSDMNLESRFQETTQEYAVTFKVEGLKGQSSFVLYFSKGAKVNLSVFEKEGYSLVAYNGEEEVTSITVDGNMEIRLVYTSLNPDSKGCGGSITTTLSLLTIISGGAIALLAFSKKKGGKKHE